jgi:hypothetical protein
MLEGTKVNIGGQEYVLAPINLRIYYAQKDAVKVVLNPKDHTQDEYIEAAMALLVPALQRNYPDLTEEAISEGIQVPDMPGYVLAMMTKAGFAKKDPLASGAPEPVAN